MSEIENNMRTNTRRVVEADSYAQKLLDHPNGGDDERLLTRIDQVFSGATRTPDDTYEEFRKYRDTLHNVFGHLAVANIVRHTLAAEPPLENSPNACDRFSEIMEGYVDSNHAPFLDAIQEGTEQPYQTLWANYDDSLQQAYWMQTDALRSDPKKAISKYGINPPSRTGGSDYLRKSLSGNFGEVTQTLAIFHAMSHIGPDGELPSPAELKRSFLEREEDYYHLSRTKRPFFIKTFWGKTLQEGALERPTISKALRDYIEGSVVEDPPVEVPLAAHDQSVIRGQLARVALARPGACGGKSLLSPRTQDRRSFEAFGDMCGAPLSEKFSVIHVCLRFAARTGEETIWYDEAAREGIRALAKARDEKSRIVQR